MGDRARFWLCAAACVAAAGCKPAAPAASDPAGNAATEQAVPATAPAAADGPLAQWIVGAWSFDTSCATDFVIRYEGDGALDNAGEVGRGALAGDQLTETVTERLENGGEAPVRVDPPVTRTYALRRIDAGHGVITYQGREVPIQRC